MNVENAMLIETHGARLQLDKGQHFRLRAAFDTRLTCAGGIAWITMEGDAGDVVLAPGDAFVAPRGTIVLVGPINGSVTLDTRSERNALAQRTAEHVVDEGLPW